MSTLSPLTPIGRLDRRVLVQRRVNAVNEYGEPVPAWSDVATVWAEVRELSGTKTFGETPEGTSQVTIRYLEGLTVAHRLVIGGTTHYLQSVTADPERRFHTLLTQNKEV